MIIIISFSNVSFENACEHYVKCYPKGYARSVQTKVVHYALSCMGIIWSILLTMVVYCIQNSVLGNLDL